MILTARAVRHLERRDRVERVSTETVARLVNESGHPTFEPWIDFHERYAGYVEPVGGGDIAILGLAQVERYAHWMKPLTVDIEFYEAEGNKEAQYEIACAEVHPSYGYRLDQHGQFFGPSGEEPVADSYDRRLEQTALFHEVKATDGWDPVLRVVPGGARNRILERVKDGLDEAASDRYSRWYVTTEWLVIEDVKTGRCRACGKKEFMLNWK